MLFLHNGNKFIYSTKEELITIVLLITIMEYTGAHIQLTITANGVHARVFHSIVYTKFNHTLFLVKTHGGNGGGANCVFPFGVSWTLSGFVLNSF